MDVGARRAGLGEGNGVNWIQILLTVAAGFALWRLWRTFGRAGRTVSLLVGLGFVLRALSGQALFWISWMRWPVGRSLQLGQGLWFFGLDSITYLTPIPDLLAHGLTALLFIDARYASHVYQQLLAFAMAAFGLSPAVGLLLNLSAYLGTCALVLRIGPAPGAPTWPRLAAITAITFSPSGILWSLQPLKDTVFIFFVVAFVAALSEWQRAWGEAGRRVRAGMAVAALVVSVYAIAGMRWYFAAILCGAAAIFFSMLALRTQSRWRSAGAVAFTLLLLVASFRLGGDTDIPRSVRSLLNPAQLWTADTQLDRVAAYVETRRVGFETTAGGTNIVVASRAVVAGSTPDPEGVALIWPRFVALVAPRSVAAWFGVEMGGGRGLWAFADMDTLIFDAVLAGALLVSAWRIVRDRASASPLFIALVLILVSAAVPMLYIVNNFGTLFRLRHMLYVVAVLIPVALPRPVTPSGSAAGLSTSAGTSRRTSRT